jgi:hypothetical protein
VCACARVRERERERLGSEFRLCGFVYVWWVLGCDVKHPPPSNAEVKERVEYTSAVPSGPSWPVIG